MTRKAKKDEKGKKAKKDVKGTKAKDEKEKRAKKGKGKRVGSEEEEVQEIQWVPSYEFPAVEDEEPTEEDDPEWFAGKAKYEELCNDADWDRNHQDHWVGVDKDGVVLDFVENQRGRFLAALAGLCIYMFEHITISIYLLVS